MIMLLTIDVRNYVNSNLILYILTSKTFVLLHSLILLKNPIFAVGIVVIFLHGDPIFATMFRFTQPLLCASLFWYFLVSYTHLDVYKRQILTFYFGLNL